MEKKRIRLREGQGIPIVLTKEQEEYLRQKIAGSRALKEARKNEAHRRYEMSICIDSDESCVCGGDIMYSSMKRFIETGPMAVGTGSAKGYYQETHKAVCGTCALLYDHTHNRFSAARTEVVVMRQPPNDDWEPPVPEEK
jgi:hypothetical protein